MLLKRIMYIFIILFLFVFYLEYPGWLSLFIFLTAIIVPFISLFSILPFRKKLSVSILLETVIYPLDTEEIRLSVVAKGDFSSRIHGTLAVTDLSSGKSTQKKIENNDYCLEFVPKHCGAYSAELSRLGMTDPLSLFLLPIPKAQAVSFFAMPKEKEISPAPDLSDLFNSSYEKKPGGGASEAYEIRPYRLGDPVNDIHWKLSAKSKDDSALVKEPQQKVMKEIIITFDLDRDREKRDLMFAHLLWFLNSLMGSGLLIYVVFLQKGELRRFFVETDEDIRTLFFTILSLPADEKNTSLSGKTLSERGWHYHVS